MIRSRRPRPALGVLLATLLLLTQVTGLHQHRHVHPVDGGYDHGSQVHFEDAGIHADDPEHAPGDAAAQASHPHADIELRLLDTGLTKSALDLSFVALLAWAIVLCLPSRARQAPPRPRASLARRPPRYAVRPPAHAPPLTRAVAV
ncbi:hypothetical protein [Sinimarinibacterium thermocellulolyticum]|uniref:Uncharacterized protein n=1 Tax=Sinimarinibacterium thermocellulolyticum TaxID=3170016 RepID=A0ABV2A5X6_9GAMM